MIRYGRIGGFTFTMNRIGYARFLVAVFLMRHGIGAFWLLPQEDR